MWNIKPNFDKIQFDLPQKVRQKFIKKVFTLATIQLIFTFCCLYIYLAYFDFNGSLILHKRFLLNPACGVFIGCLCFIISSEEKSVYETSKLNSICFVIFSMTLSYVIAYFIYDPENENKTFFIFGFRTILTLLILGLYALTSKTEVTYLKGSIIVFLFAFGVGLILCFYGMFDISNALFFALKSMLTGLYFVYDIKQILRYNKISGDEYLSGVLYLIYVDFFFNFQKLIIFMGDKYYRKR